MKNRVLERLKRLNEDTGEILNKLDGLSDDQLSDTSYGWSIIQVMSHLNDAENASLSYMKKKVQAGDKMHNAGVMNSLRMWLTNQALKSSLKWKAPSYISKPQTYQIDEMKVKWSDTRKAIENFVKDYPEEWMNKLVYKHPMGGRQNLSNAVNSFIYHQIHHVHQINRIKKRLGI